MLLQCFFVAVLVFQACVAQLPATANCSNVSPGEFPFHVFIRWVDFPNQPNCMGAILDEKNVLTTAYCCLYSGFLEVIAGGNFYLEDEASKQKSLVSEVRSHKGYENGFSPYDLCIMKLVTDLVFNENVSAAQLPVKNEVPTGSAVLCAWNNITEDIPPTSVALKEIAVPIINNYQCLENLTEIILGLKWTISLTQMCTTVIATNVNCGAIPGSLLVQRQNISDSSPGNETVTLIGIFSWGDYLHPAHVLPGVYMRISSFIDWIYLNRF